MKNVVDSESVVIYRYENNPVTVKGKTVMSARNYYYHIEQSCITNPKRGNPSVSFPLCVKMMDRRVRLEKHPEFVTEMEQKGFIFYQ